jgi:hypothetical protein
MRSLRGLLAALVMLTLSQGVIALQEPPPRSPRNASYRLEATLDPVNRLILGRGRLTWRNIATVPATELRFHMYWNAWRHPSSSWLREQALGRDRTLAERPDEDRASIDLTTLALVGAGGRQEVLPRARYIAPDDGNAEDQTVLAVALDRPVQPGESLDVDFAWTARVPRTYARTGGLGDFFFIAQWFPKIGVLEDTGWHCRQFHAATEFYADYGVYDVRLTVPRGWVVGATGREQGQTPDSAGTHTTHHYRAHDVHDFAWTTSPDYQERRQRFEAPGLPAVDMRLLLQPEHESQAERHFEATRATLRYFGTWFGAYPYDHLTVIDPVTIVNPAAQGGSAGGMEYPTLFTAGTRRFAPWRGAQPEEVTIHEAGHQFWYGVVGTNEFDHAWMDEGITTYATARMMEEAFPGRFVIVERYFGGLIPWAYTDVAWSRDVHGNRLNPYRRAPARDRPSTPTWQYWPGTAAVTTYTKTALWLATLERVLGWETMQRVLAAYFSKGAFRHPTPDEFFVTASDVSGRDLTWFVDAVYRSAATFDYSVEQVTDQVADSGARDSTVVVRRLGTGVFPIDVRVSFGDGADVTERWDGQGEWRAFRYRRGARVTTVEVDPARVLLLDLNTTNNTWTARPRGADAARHWSLRWLIWLQNVLLTYAFVA